MFLERTGDSVTAVSLVTGASPPVGPAPAMDMQTTATPKPDAASTAGTIALDTPVTGAWTATMETQCWGRVITVVRASVPMVQTALGSLQEAVTVVMTLSRSCVCATWDTRVLAVMSAHLVTMETQSKPGDSVSYVSVTETSTRLIPSPVMPGPASVGAACTTVKVLPVRAASRVTMATHYSKTAGSVSVTSLARTPLTVRRPVTVTARGAAVSVTASQTLLDNTATPAHLTPGTWPVAPVVRAATVTPNTHTGHPATRSVASAPVSPVLGEEPAASVGSCSGETQRSSATPVTVILGVCPNLSVTKKVVTVSVLTASPVLAVMSVLVDSPEHSLTVTAATSASQSGTM